MTIAPTLSREEKADIIDYAVDHAEKYGWIQDDEGWDLPQEYTKEYQHVCAVGGVRAGCYRYLYDRGELDMLDDQEVIKILFSRSICDNENVWTKIKEATELIDAVFVQIVFKELDPAILNLFEGQADGFDSMTSYNDWPERSQQEVFDFMRKTAKELRT